MGIGTVRFCLAVITVLCPAIVSAVDLRNAPPSLPHLPVLSSIVVNPAEVVGGAQQVGGTVTLSQPAPAGGTTITLQSSNPAVAAVPGRVVVQPGALSASFVIMPRPVATNPNVVPGTVMVTISASVGANQPKTAILTVFPPAFTSLSLNPASVPGGAGSVGTVTISGPAPAGGYLIALSSQNPAATVPQSVTIPSGANTATFPVATTTVGTSTAGAIVATRGAFVSKAVQFTVQPPGVASVTLSNNFIANHYPSDGGIPINGEVKLTAPAPSAGAAVQLSVTPTYANTPAYSCLANPTFPTTVQIPAGGTKASFVINTTPGTTSFSYASNSQYTEDAPFDFHASFGGTSASFHFSIRPNRVKSLSVTPTSVKGGSAVQAIAKLMSQAPPLPQSCANVVRLASSNPLVAQVPATVAIPTGQQQVPFTVTTSSVAQTIQVTIMAYPSYHGNVNTAEQVTLTVTPN